MLPFVQCFTCASQLVDMKQAISEKQSLVDEMELQLMRLAPDSIPCVLGLREELNNLHDEVELTEFLHAKLF